MLLCSEFSVLSSQFSALSSWSLGTCHSPLSLVGSWLVTCHSSLSSISGASTGFEVTLSICEKRVAQSWCLANSGFFLRMCQPADLRETKVYYPELVSILNLSCRFVLHMRASTEAATGGVFVPIRVNIDALPAGLRCRQNRFIQSLGCVAAGTQVPLASRVRLPALSSRKHPCCECGLYPSPGMR